MVIRHYFQKLPSPRPRYYIVHDVCVLSNGWVFLLCAKGHVVAECMWWKREKKSDFQKGKTIYMITLKMKTKTLCVVRHHFSVERSLRTFQGISYFIEYYRWEVPIHIQDLILQLRLSYIYRKRGLCRGAAHCNKRRLASKRNCVVVVLLAVLPTQQNSCQIR